MHNPDLAKDYITRADVRLKAIQVLYDHQSWADVVRESQEVVELALQALLRHCNIEIPRIHDVSKIILQEASRIPQELTDKIKVMSKISKTLRRDREIAFYGTEDLTPSEFYDIQDAEQAFDHAKNIVSWILPHIK